ncbi:MAG: hypothetical protein A2X48_04390 [Lentisphaerae bacterium GWF2_49_21]|nr:MAG: hypothetical protein A2X48_04390 [Lentisphaerae bacterium GWF2_49_21]
MIKNYHLVKEAEAEYQSKHKPSLEERFKLLNDMYVFSKEFEKEGLPPEETSHVKMLIRLANTFKKIGEFKND